MNLVTFYLIDTDTSLLECMKDIYVANRTDYRYLGGTDRGEEGFNRVLQLKPNVLVISYPLSDVDLSVLLNSIKQQAPKTKIIVTVEDDDLLLQYELIERYGVSYVIKKPFSFEKLETMMSKLSIDKGGIAEMNEFDNMNDVPSAQQNMQSAGDTQNNGMFNMNNMNMSNMGMPNGMNNMSMSNTINGMGTMQNTGMPNMNNMGMPNMMPNMNNMGMPNMMPNMNNMSMPNMMPNMNSMGTPNMMNGLGTMPNMGMPNMCGISNMGSMPNLENPNPMQNNSMPNMNDDTSNQTMDDLQNSNMDSMNMGNMNMGNMNMPNMNMGNMNMPNMNMGMNMPNMNMGNMNIPNMNMGNMNMPNMNMGMNMGEMPKMSMGSMDEMNGSQTMGGAGFNTIKQRIIAINCPKGGVGKTTVSKELATAFSKAKVNGHPLKVCLVDCDFEFGDIANMLNLPASPTVNDWVEDIKEKIKQGHSLSSLNYTQPQIEKYMLTTDTGIKVLAAPTNVADSLEIDKDIMDFMLNSLQKCDYDLIILDTANNTKDFTMSALYKAQEILMIATLEYTTIGDLKQLLFTLKTIQFPLSKIKLVINKMPAADIDLGAEEVANYLGIEIIAKIPDVNKKIRQVNNSGKPAVLGPETEFTRAIRQLGNHIMPVFDMKSVNKEAKKKQGMFAKLFGR